MNAIRKMFLPILAAMLMLSGCASKEVQSSDKIEVIASLFPQYDFARQIGGDKVDVSLLLSPGQESHMYDPSPSDMQSIASSDMFIFTGEMMEGWAADIASSIGSENVKIVDASVGASYIEGGDEHDHGNEDADHDSNLDPHIWLDFDNAKKMCENIAAALCEISPENADYFNQNLASYEAELTELDNAYSEAFSSSYKPLVFGGKFALGYLVNRYNVNYISAYASCGSEAEPSVKDIQEITQFVKDNDIKAIYCEEFSDPKVSRSIVEGTDAEILEIHSAENTSKDERDNDTTFIYLMQKNLDNIRKGL